MKKRGCLILSGLLGAFGLFAQETVLRETLVESPRFVGEKNLVLEQEVKKAPIYDFIRADLENEYANQDVYDEGIVIVSFVVETNGYLSNINVQNSVASELDQCVVDCIKATNGMWLPGRVNGNPSAMESKVYVRFDIPGNAPHEKIAAHHVQLAAKHYEKGMELRSNSTLEPRKSNQQFKKALNQLDLATKYQPEEAGTVFFQAMAYEKVGDDLNKAIKLLKYMEIENGLTKQHNEPDIAELVIIKHKK